MEDNISKLSKKEGNILELQKKDTANSSDLKSELFESLKKVLEKSSNSEKNMCYFSQAQTP